MTLLSLPLVGGCGAGAPAQLDVSIAAKGGAQVKAGDRAEYVITVDNRGGTATGVTVRLSLPAAMRLAGTLAVDEVNGAARTEPSDPVPHSQEPAWGMWALPAATVDADGTPRRAGFTVDFNVDVDGSPGGYQLTPIASSAEGDADVNGQPLAVGIVPAPQLSLTLTALNLAIRAGDTEHYRLTVTNAGSGAATGAAITLTLPAPFAFGRNDGITGTATRSGAIDPYKGSLVAFWSGFSIPAQSNGIPGLLILTFEAQCVPQGPGGTYTVSGQVTDDAGDVVQLPASAPVIVVAAPTPRATPAPAVPSPLS